MILPSAIRTMRRAVAAIPLSWVMRMTVLPSLFSCWRKPSASGPVRGSNAPGPPKEEPTEPVFDIDYWISFAKSYAESIGLVLDNGAVYCWDNPIAAGVKCKYTERDIRGYLDRYAKDGDITDVWIWYEQAGSGSYEIYIGYA